jgi:hypothetical protein
MDGDVAVEPEVDSFSRVLPLPYRVAIIIVLGAHAVLCRTTHTDESGAGIWAWGLNLHYLHFIKIVCSDDSVRETVD